MAVMLELCTRVKRENELTAKRRKFTGLLIFFENVFNDPISYAFKLR